jgi:hypothetical protein
MHHRVSLHPAILIGGGVIVAIVVIAGLWQAFSLPYGMLKLWTVGASLAALVPAAFFLATSAAATAYALWFTPAVKLRTDRDKILTLESIWNNLLGAILGVAVIWLVVLVGAWLLAFLDEVFGGFINLHIIRSLQNGLVGPVADTLSFGLVTGVVNDPARWAVGLVCAGFSFAAAFQAVRTNLKQGYRQPFALSGLVTGWVADLTMFYVLLAYGVWSAVVVTLVHLVITDTIRYVHWRNEGGVELLPPQG